MGGGGELERTLNDAFGISEKTDSWKNFAKDAKILRLRQKYSETKSAKSKL